MFLVSRGVADVEPVRQPQRPHRDRCVTCAAKDGIDHEEHQDRHVAGERRLEFRIGINLGDIVAEEHDIYGDGVNVAARLEGLAEPGGVLVSRTVRDHVRDKLSLGSAMATPLSRCWRNTSVPTTARLSRLNAMPVRNAGV